MWMRCVAGLLWLVSQMAAAQADARLPLVDADGMVTAALRYSDVVRQFGQPADTTVTPERRDWVSPRMGRCDVPVVWRGLSRNDDCLVVTGGHFEISYPERGLRFVVRRTDRPKGDPPIWLVSVQGAPAGQTPQGLRIGMPAAEAEALARRHYRVLAEYRRADGLLLHLGDAAARSPHVLELTMAAGVVSGMDFDLLPSPPWSPPNPWAFAAVQVAAVVGLAVLVAWWRRRAGVRRPTPAPALRRGLGRLGLVVGLCVLAGALAAGGYAAMALTSGDGQAMLVGLYVAGFAAVFGVGALVVIVKAWRALREP